MAKLHQAIFPSRKRIILSDDDFKKLESVASISLPQTARNEVQEFLNRYVFDMDAEKHNADYHRVVRKISDLRAQAESISDFIGRMGTSGSNHMQRSSDELVAHAFIIYCAHESRFVNIDDLEISLRGFVAACGEALKELPNKRLGSVKRSTRRNAYKLLFESIAPVFEQAGNFRATAYNLPHAHEDGSKFVDFLFCLLQHVPREYRPPSKGALGKQVRDWRHGTGSFTRQREGEG